MDNVNFISKYITLLLDLGAYGAMDDNHTINRLRKNIRKR
jgi:hypothetical protein